MKRKKMTSVWASALLVAAVGVIFSGCFIFYNGSIDGFEIDGIYDGAEKIDLCSDDTVRSNLRWHDDSFDELPDDDKSGSIAFNINRTCLSADTNKGRNGFDFVSPPLTDWDDISGFNFAVKSAITADHRFHHLQVQPLLKIQKPDGDTVFQPMVDDFGGHMLFTVQNDWAWHTFTYERPVINPDDKVIELRVRVFIPDEMIARLGSDSNFVYLDTVIPQRP